MVNKTAFGSPRHCPCTVSQSIHSWLHQHPHSPACWFLWAVTSQLVSTRHLIFEVACQACFPCDASSLLVLMKHSSSKSNNKACVFNHFNKIGLPSEPQSGDPFCFKTWNRSLVQLICKHGYALHWCGLVVKDKRADKHSETAYPSCSF